MESWAAGQRGPPCREGGFPAGVGCLRPATYARALEELEACFDEFLDADGRVRGDELAYDLLCGGFGIAQHLQGADGFLRSGGVEWLYLLAAGGRRRDSRRGLASPPRAGSLPRRSTRIRCAVFRPIPDRLERPDLPERDDALQLGGDKS